MSRQPVALPPHFRWNFTSLVVDYVSFWTAITFVSIPSVMPAFVRELTDSPIMVGLISTIYMAGIFLPQLAVARLINDKPLKKPYARFGLLGRPMLLIIAAALWAGLAERPSAMLAVFFVCLGLFATSDGGASVAWFDVVARAIPADRRGRLYAIGQVISGATGVAVGGLVALILGSSSLPFPRNYALLFTLAGVAMIPSSVALYLLREPPPDGRAASQQERTHGPSFKAVLADPAFRRLVGCRLLIGMLNLSASFYVGHAEDVLLLPSQIVGGFVSAQTAAGLVGSIVMGIVTERHGPRAVIRIATGAAALAPLYALLAHVVRSNWLVQAYPLVYVALGVVNTAWIMGFMSYMLEIAPEGMRPAYIGLGNTITGVTAAIPTVGGWLLNGTSYSVLFGLTAAFNLAGWFLSMGLPNRTGQLAESEPTGPAPAAGDLATGA
ncbi:MAG: MFS transporter [Anaerolineales bacterium]|nr:MFS transporter [Anaerolineales bacterium]